MSIVAYTGLPGSGKTYSVVEHQIIPALKQGRTVVTNIPLHMDLILALDGVTGTVVDFPTETVVAEPHKIYDYVTPGCVFVLDEVWKIFPQGMNANKVPDEYKKLLAEHRHMVDAAGNSTQIVFVVQDLANIGAFARRLVENTFVSTKLSHVGMSKAYRVDVFHGAQTGATPPVSSRLRFLTGRYRPEVYALYKSQTMSQADEHGSEKKIDNRANIFRRPAFIIGAIAAPLAIAWGLWKFNKAFSEMGDPHKGVVHMKGDAQGAAAERSEGAAPAAAPSRGRAPGPAQPRLIMMVVGMPPLQVSGAIAAADSVYLVQGSDCASELVFRSIHWRCRWRGHWYDASGPIPDPPTG